MRVLTVALILACGVPSYAAEPPPEAVAKARASLALSKAKSSPGVVTAPAPRPAILEYQEAKKFSLERGLPVVVFVGCDPVRVSESLVVSVPKMEGYAPGTVLVCYPAGGSLWADVRISFPAPPEVIESAVKAAGKKIDVKPQGKRLDWS
jgi:hypothetical protein